MGLQPSQLQTWASGIFSGSRSYWKPESVPGDRRNERPQACTAAEPHKSGPGPEPEFKKEWRAGTSLIVRWLRLRALQVRAWVRSPLRIPETWCSQINSKTERNAGCPLPTVGPLTPRPALGTRQHENPAGRGFLPGYFSRGHVTFQASQVALVVKNMPANARDAGSVPGSGRFPGGGHGNPLQCSCLENPTSEKPRGYSPWGHSESDTTEAT